MLRFDDPERNSQSKARFHLERRLREDFASDQRGEDGMALRYRNARPQSSTITSIVSFAPRTDTWAILP